MRFKFLNKMLAIVLTILLVFPISSLAFADAEINTPSDVVTEETAQQIEVAEPHPLTVESDEEAEGMIPKESEEGILNIEETTVVPLLTETPKTAFAIYSDDDKSLNFYKRDEIPNAGDAFEGKTVRNVYTDIESISLNVRNGPDAPWYGIRNNVTNISVVDDGIQPISLSKWFSDFSKLTSVDVLKLDTSRVADMYYAFTGCSSLTSLDLSG